jgi:hypothetical protein
VTSNGTKKSKKSIWHQPRQSFLLQLDSISSVFPGHFPVASTKQDESRSIRDEMKCGGA